MNKEFPRKIHIIGSVHYELDNIVWIRQNSGNIRRTDQQKADYLQN